LPGEVPYPNRFSEEELESPEPPPWLDEAPCHLSPDDFATIQDADPPPSVEEERIMVPDITSASAPRGPIAHPLGPCFCYRESQVEMARLVRQALPEAILALKQGVGRLIRTETDRGVMAILDSRVGTRRYAQQIMASLPRARRTRPISDVREFFAQEPA
jgi:hypothetical protein